MKKDLNSTILQAALGVILLAAVFCCIKYVFATRDIRSLNYKLSEGNARRTTMQAFLNDCMAYSEKNPAILPLLETVGIKKNAPIPTKPAR
ncbi:MAG: hypothetical protein EPO07_18510 [Verrucomicrobia bacterium]|nr:MAG: hypothetical protein EPO07_18510 [Verrucomicrobiota bacterium]